MRFFLAFIVLFSIPAFAQNKAMEFKVDCVLADDSDPTARKFTIHYSLCNLTPNKLSFFFKPERLTPNTWGSMSNAPYYKIYQNEEFMDLGNVFDRSDNNSATGEHLKFDPKNNELTDEMIRRLAYEFEMNDSLIAAYKKTGFLAADLKQRHHSLMEDKFELDPHETKTFTKTVYWNKNKYFFNEPNEFYLDENAKHFIELTLVLIKDHFKDRLTAEEYASIMADKNFIKGIYISNRAEINFSE